MKVLIVDCFDSFTFNLYQQVGKLGGEPMVLTCDTPIRRIRNVACDRIILSPGPGTPEDAGVCHEVLDTMSRTIPTLGVCLGHQAICTAFGGKVGRAGHLMHGKTSKIRHDGRGAFFRACGAVCCNPLPLACCTGGFPAGRAFRHGNQPG